MSNTSKRTTIHFDPKLLSAVRLKSKLTDRSVSHIVNEAVRLALHEDLADSAIIEERANEPAMSYDALLNRLKGRGKL